jgi:L-threonylcarbamoyladenylate synthase
MLAERDARELERCVAGGGVALFPADTVYGLCCDPENRDAVRRLYELKGYPPSATPERPAAVMFFALERLLEAMGELDAHERGALRKLLPGPVTLLVPNRAGRFALASGPDPETLGLRVPRLSEALAGLAHMTLPVLQSSANMTGEPEARRLGDVPARLRDGVDLALDGGELPGRPSTVIDLRRYASDGSWQVLREGALSTPDVERLTEQLRRASVNPG